MRDPGREGRGVEGRGKGKQDESQVMGKKKEGEVERKGAEGIGSVFGTRGRLGRRKETGDHGR